MNNRAPLPSARGCVGGGGGGGRCSNLPLRTTLYRGLFDSLTVMERRQARRGYRSPRPMASVRLEYVQVLITTKEYAGGIY